MTVADEPIASTTTTGDNAVRGVVRGHVVAAVGTMRPRLAEPWTLDRLPDEVQLSRSQLVRCFDTTTGLSPMAYLRKMRVERMARLLASTDLSVAEAARSVGWKNQFHASAAGVIAWLTVRLVRSHGDSRDDPRRRAGLATTAQVRKVACGRALRRRAAMLRPSLHHPAP